MLKLSKYLFFKKEVLFLGYLISIEGIKIDLKKVKLVIE